MNLKEFWKKSPRWEIQVVTWLVCPSEAFPELLLVGVWYDSLVRKILSLAVAVIAHGSGALTPYLRLPLYLLLSPLMSHQVK